MPIIEVKHLAKKYPLPGKKSEFFYAVDGISLNIDGGSATIDGIDVASPTY